MKTYQFKCPATETLYGTAFFSVDASSREEAIALLCDDAAQYFDEFSESDGGTEWEASQPGDFEEA